MPITKGSATFADFRVRTEARTPADWKKTLPRALKARAFRPLDLEGADDRAQGFVELGDRDAVDFSVGAVFDGEWAVFAWRVDEVRLPSAYVRAELEKWERAFRLEHGRPPGRREKNDAKAAVRRALRARFPLASKAFDVAWDLEGGRLQVWAGPQKAVDEVSDAVEQAFKVRLVPVAPVTLAEALKIPEKVLVPTPLLSLPDAPEARDGRS